MHELRGGRGRPARARPVARRAVRTWGAGHVPAAPRGGVMTTTEERKPPRWAIARGVPEDAVVVRALNGVARFVRGDDSWSVDPDGRLVHTRWVTSKPAPPTAPAPVTVDDAVRSLAGPYRQSDYSYEEFCA